MVFARIYHYSAITSILSIIVASIAAFIILDPIINPILSYKASLENQIKAAQAELDEL